MYEEGVVRMQHFQAFDVVHSSWLIGIVFFICLNIYFYKRISFQQQKKWRIVIFWTLLVSEVFKQLYFYFTNSYSYWSPPLHLCGLGIFIIGYHTYRANVTSATLLYALTLPGAVIALLFPGWTNEPIGSFLHIHSFVFHALLVVYVVVLVANKELKTREKELWRAVLFLLVTVPPIYVYNHQFNTNFMFLNRPVKGTPLQLLYDAAGSSGYLASLCAVLIVVWIVLYRLKWTY